MRNNSNTYWDNRVGQILADNHQSSTKQLKRIGTAYNKALQDTQKDINKIFVKYANGHNLTVEQAKRYLNEQISNTEANKLRRKLSQISNEELKKDILARLNANAYRARITRLEALKQSIAINYTALTDEELKLSTEAYVNTIKNSYYKNIYEIQKGMNLGFNVASINTRAINMILGTEWAGYNYSTRVWKNTKTLADNLDSIITKGFISGKSLSKLAKELQEQTDCGRYAAERLIRTETTFFNNQAALQGYQEVGIEKYVFVATLDKRTCNCGHNGKLSCGELDRKVFLISEQKAGVNCPPVHPFCRCTTRAYLGDEELEACQRRARNPETGKNELVGNMSYKEWRKKYLDKDSAKAKNHKDTNADKYRVKQNELINSKKEHSKNIDKNINFEDVTQNYVTGKPKPYTIVQQQFYDDKNGKRYIVDGKNVVLRPTQKEIEVANLIGKMLGGDINLVPVVLNPPKIKTPDYLTDGKRFDLKEVSGTSKNCLDNIIKNKKEQAHNFIFDISKTKLTEDEIYEQIKGIYRASHRDWVEQIIVIKNDSILKVFMKK